MAEKETEKKVKKAGVDYNLDGCNIFADKVAEMLKLEKTTIHINRAESYDAPRLNKDGKQICWILPRNNKDLMFSVYLFHPNQQREIIDVSNNNDAKNAIKKIEGVANQINEKKIVKKVTKKPAKPRDFESIKNQISRLKKGNKMVIPSGFDETNVEFVKVVEQAGGKIEKNLIVRLA